MIKPAHLVLAAATLITSATVPAIATADETNPAIVHRQGIYKIAGGHMNAIKSILFLGFDAPQDVKYHASAMVDGFMHMGNSYPEGSDFGETKAKEEIWSDMDGFKQRGKEMMMAAKALVAAAEGGDKGEMIGAFKELGGKCKACHDDYRKK
jgi:cytochrome c556